MAIAATVLIALAATVAGVVIGANMLTDSVTETQSPAAGEFEGAEAACRSFRQPAGQLSIAITAFTYDSYDSESIGLCAMARTATASVVSEIDQLGGVPYTHNRTSNYLHASHNACDIIDNITFSQVHGLDPDGKYPGFANWSCFWHMEDGTQVALFFRRDKLNYGNHYGDREPIAGKDTFRDTSRASGEEKLPG